MKKKIISICLVVALLAVGIVGATLAYFTDTDSATNTFTLGNVKIALHEGAYKTVQKNGAPIDKDGNVDTSKANPNAQEGDDFGYDYLDETYQSWLDDQTLMPGTQSYNRIQKRIFVENTGSYDAYVRVIVGIPAALDTPTDASKNILHFNNVTGDVNNKWYGWTYDAKAGEGKTSGYAFTQKVGEGDEAIDYNYYVYYYTDVVEDGDATKSEVLSYFYLDEHVDFDGTNYTYNGKTIDFDFSDGIDILVYAEAIQAEGFDNYTAAWTAYGDPAIKNA